MRCIHCGSANNLITLQCHHSICFDCLYSKYENSMSIPFCCYYELKFSLLFEYLNECDIMSSFPEFLDTKLSYQERIQSIQSKHGQQLQDIYFRGLHFRSRNHRSFHTHFGLWRPCRLNNILNRFRRAQLPLSFVGILSKELYHVYAVNRDNPFLISCRNILSKPQDTEKFLIHYHRKGILFEYTCDEVERNNYYYDIHYINYVFVISKISTNITSEYIREKFRGNIITAQGKSKTRLQQLNLHSIVHIPDRYRNLRYHVYNNHNYSNNEKKFQNFRYIHFTDMVVVERKHKLRQTFLLVFYKSKAQTINSYDIRREIFSFLDI